MNQYIKKETRLADFDPCPRFIWNEGLSSLAISVYTLLLGRVSLSKQNDMIDEQGRVYVIYTVKHMAEKLSRSEPPIYAALKMLEEKGYQVLLTREPGGVEIAEQIRNVILDKKNTSMDAKTEALLYAAARRQHLVEKVIPALKKGTISNKLRAVWLTTISTLQKRKERKRKWQNIC